MKRENLLMVADSERDADMLYAVGIFVPDPFIFLRARGRNHAILGNMEYDRARRCATGVRVLSWDRYCLRLRREGVRSPGFSAVIKALLSEHRLRKVMVPDSFPHGLARELARKKVKIKVCGGAVFPERNVKSADEVKKINAALMMAEVGLAEALQVLRNTKIGRNRRLMHHQVPLTAEKLRAIIEIAVLQAGGSALHTIVAGGRQACDPHEQGHGVLRAHEPIILDVFPRSQRTGYYGDISRTVVKGRASEGVRRLYATVRGAQETTITGLRAGMTGGEVQREIKEAFEQAGYRTGRQNGCLRGFFHSAGHGLGLQLHEGPRIGTNSEDLLVKGNVVAIEPGLYYPELGGVRLEDVVELTSRCARPLSRFEKVLEV